jgi:hypothetical protein
MGKAKAWKNEETIVLARAYIAASEDRSETRGADQTKKVVWDHVIEEIKARAPLEGPATIGRYHNRGASAIESRFLDKIQPDVLNFNKALMIIYRSKPTGCTEQNKINMAVALHLGKSDHREYRHKEFDPFEWSNYACWMVLRRHPKFLPPRQPRTEEEGETVIIRIKIKICETKAEETNSFVLQVNTTSTRSK